MDSGIHCSAVASLYGASCWQLCYQNNIYSRQCRGCRDLLNSNSIYHPRAVKSSSMAATGAEQETALNPMLNNRKLNLDDLAISVNSTACITHTQMKEPHPQLKKARQSACYIQEQESRKLCGLSCLLSRFD